MESIYGLGLGGPDKIRPIGADGAGVGIGICIDGIGICIGGGLGWKRSQLFPQPFPAAIGSSLIVKILFIGVSGRSMAKPAAYYNIFIFYL